MERKQIIKKTLNIFGNVISIFAIYFVIKKLLDSSLDYSIIFKQKNIVAILFIILILSLIVITNCFPWKTLVELLSNKMVPWKESIQVYVKSNLLKYLPGNVFQYVGRNQLALKLNLSHIQVATATVIDVAVNVLAGVLISSIYFFRNGTTYLKISHDTYRLMVIILLFCFIAFLILCYCFRKKIAALIRKYDYLLTFSTIKVVFICLFYYVITMLIQSLLFIFVLVYVLNVSLTMDLFFKLFSAYTFSWLVGFLTPGAPAGIGVREAVMASAAGGLVNESTITFAMVIFRVLTTMADGVAFLLVSGYRVLTKARKN